MQIFLSYRANPDTDEKEAILIYKHITENWGYKCFFARETIPPGANSNEAISNGLNTSDLMIGLMSAEAIASSNVIAEWHHAVHRYPKDRLLLLRLDECSLNGHYKLEMIQYVDYLKRQPDTLEKLKRRAQEIEAEINGGSASGAQLIIVPPPRLPERPSVQKELIEKVQNQWIDSVLHPAMHGIEMMATELVPRPHLIATHARYGNAALESPKDILSAFKRANQLLIIGAPGSGKTIQLLQLADELLKDACDNPKASIPVVLSLSSWMLFYNPKAKRPQPFIDWLAQEFKAFYQVEQKFAKRLINSNLFILLLDGLDEIGGDEEIDGHKVVSKAAQQAQSACIQAINRFRQEHSQIQLVVCCRLKNYEDLPVRLNADVIIHVENLKPAQVIDYLRGKPELQSLSDGVQQDSHLMTLACIPFYLAILVKTYHARPIDALLATMPDNRAVFLLDTYMQSRFRLNDDYDLQETGYFLGVIAAWMKTSSLSIFTLEQMQFKMLPQLAIITYFVITRIILVLLNGVPFGLLGVLVMDKFFHLSPGWDTLGIIILGAGGIITLTIERFFARSVRALLMTCAIFLIGYAVAYQIDPQFNMTFIVGIALVLGFLFWVMLRLGLGSINEDHQDIFPVEIIRPSWNHLIISVVIVALLAVGLMLTKLPIDGLAQALIVLIACFLPNALTGGFVGQAEIIGNITEPGVGISRSRHNGLIVMGGIGLLALISSGMASLGVGLSPLDALQISLAGALASGATAGVLFGLADAMKYWLLRYLQVYTHKTPSDLRKFLNFTVSTEFMRRTGRGFLFIHRFLLDHVAEIYKQRGQLAD